VTLTRLPATGEASPRPRLLGLIALGVAAPFLLNGWLSARVAHDPLLYWSAEIAVWVVVPGVGLFLASRFCGLTLAQLRFRRQIRTFGHPAVLGLACAAFCGLLYTVYWVSYRTFSAMLPGGGVFHYEAAVPDSGALRVLVVAYFALTAGFVEEVLYRGVALEASRSFRSPIAVYLMLSPPIFAIVHWESGAANVAAAYVVGLFTCLAYLALRNIWPLIVAHTFTDYVWFS